MRVAVLARGKQAFDVARAQSLVNDLADATGLALQLKAARAEALTFEVVSTSELAGYRRMAAEIGRRLGRSRVLVRYLGLDAVVGEGIGSSQRRAGRLAGVLGRCGHVQGRDLTDLLEESGGLAHDLKEVSLVAELQLLAILQEAKASRRPAEAGSLPLALAGRLARGAVRVLPVTARGRYREEFESKLYELAAAEASRWTQFLYGIRLVDRAWVLRAELRLAARRRVRS